MGLQVALPCDMEPAWARYKNYVTDQRYHDAVDETRNEMENLFIQIRIVFSIVGTQHRGGKIGMSQVISGPRAP